MKEFIIVFVVAMIATTIWNGLNFGSPSAADTPMQPATTLGATTPSQDNIQSLRDAATTLNAPSGGATGRLPANTAHNPGS